MHTHTHTQFAAHQLDKNAKQWESNAMADAARRMAKLMMQMAKFTRYIDQYTIPLVVTLSVYYITSCYTLSILYH